MYQRCQAILEFEYEKNMISVITPSFNQALFIEETIRSVLSQEVNSPFEYIVMDGGSDDGTLEILKKFDGRLKWFSGKDDGQSDAVNKGIAKAGGDIIGWLNSDDIYLPGTLQKVEEYFARNPRCNWLYGKCRIIDEEGREIRRWMTLYKNLASKRFYYPLLLIENFISQPAVFFRKSAFEEAGRLKPGLSLAQDYDLWIRLAKSGPPGVLQDYLASFRIHKKAKSSTYSKKQFIEQYNIHKSHDHGIFLLLLHRINIARVIIGYWLIEKFNRLQKK